MNPLSGVQWLVAGGILMLLLAGGITLHHKGVVAGKAEVQSRWDQYKLDQQALVNKQLADRDAEILHQQDLNHKAEEDHAKLKTDYAALADRLASSLRQYAATRDPSRHTLPASAADPSEPAHTSTSASRPGEAAELAGLTSDAVRACYADAAQLRALLDTLN